MNWIIPRTAALSIFLPEQDGKLRFMVETRDKNGQAVTFEGGLVLAHTGETKCAGL